MARSSRSSRKTGAVVAALAVGATVGVAFGTFVLTPNLPGGTAAVGASSDAELATAREEAEVNAVQASQADSVIDHIAEDIVSGALTDRPVLVLRTHDADDEDVGNIAWLLRTAGAIDAGRITLEENFFSQGGADQLKSIVANTLPAGAQLSTDRLDPGTHAGEALGAGLMLSPEDQQPLASSEDRALLLGALREAGFIDYEDGTILPAQVIVLVTGDSDGSGEAGFAADNQALFARALDSVGTGAVVAGRVHTAADNGVIGLLRSNPDARENVSTIDSADRTWGRVATVLAVREELAGSSGAYGSAASADAATPTFDSPLDAG